jgi:hypothetical protein
MLSTTTAWTTTPALANANPMPDLDENLGGLRLFAVAAVGIGTTLLRCPSCPTAFSPSDPVTPSPHRHRTCGCQVPDAGVDHCKRRSAF